MPAKSWLGWSLVAAAVAIAASVSPAAAHPHVWVEVGSTVLYEAQRISGIRHTWTFDDAYTEMAIEGLDTNGDGAYSREELAELAKVNIDGLKEFAYFTFAKLGTADVKFKEPTDYYLEYKNKLLTLNFTLPLDQPILAEAEGFSFSVFDESFFIAFDFGKDNPVKLSAGAPEGCAANVSIPQNELDQLQSLNNAFGGQLTAGNANAGMGNGYSKTVTIGCKKHG